MLYISLKNVTRLFRWSKHLQRIIILFVYLFLVYDIYHYVQDDVFNVFNPNISSKTKTVLRLTVPAIYLFY